MSDENTDKVNEVLSFRQKLCNGDVSREDVPESILERIKNMEEKEFLQRQVLKRHLLHTKPDSQLNI